VVADLESVAVHPVCAIRVVTTLPVWSASLICVGIGIAVHVRVAVHVRIAVHVAVSLDVTIGFRFSR